MKIFLFTILLAVLTGGSAHAQRYPYRNCQHSNSKACQDARRAFAKHHNGVYPEQWFNSNYQGQPGRWRWENAERDTWYRPYRNCRNNNSKACQDARQAFAEHHNGLTPERWFNENYQGQPGRWLWDNAEGDTWYQGLLGHWFQEPEGWRFRGDNGDEYRKGDRGWGWIRGLGTEIHEHVHGDDHDHD